MGIVLWVLGYLALGFMMVTGFNDLTDWYVDRLAAEKSVPAENFWKEDCPEHLTTFTEETGKIIEDGHDRHYLSGYIAGCLTGYFICCVTWPSIVFHNVQCMLRAKKYFAAL